MQVFLRRRHRLRKRSVGRTFSSALNKHEVRFKHLQSISQPFQATQRCLYMYRAMNCRPRYQMHLINAPVNANFLEHLIAIIQLVKVRLNCLKLYLSH